MIEQWAKSLGLVATPLFGDEKVAYQGNHRLLLDGVTGSFAMSEVRSEISGQEAANWAWSSGVLHHVTSTENEILLSRWDKQEQPRYSRKSVEQRLN